MARKKSWEDHLTQVLFTKPAEVVPEACQVLEKHGCSVKEKLKSELSYSSTLFQVVFQVLHYANLIVAHAPTAFVHTHTHTHVLTTHTHTLRILKSKPHPFAMVGLTQIIKAFVGRPGNTLEETCTIGGTVLHTISIATTQQGLETPSIVYKFVLITIVSLCINWQ